MSDRSTRRGTRTSVALGLATLLLASLLAYSPGTAGADTVFPPTQAPNYVVTVTTNSTTYTYPAGGPGPTIPGVVDGQVFTVTITSSDLSSNFSRLRIRLCDGDDRVRNLADFNPALTNKCSSVTLGSGSPWAFVDSGPVPPGTTTITRQFTVGTGRAPSIISAFDGSRLDGFRCDHLNPCRLAVNGEITTGGGASSYITFPMTFAPPAGTLIECDEVNATASATGITNVERGHSIRTLSSDVSNGCFNVHSATTGPPAALNPVSLRLTTPNRAPFGDKNTQGLSCSAGPDPDDYPVSGRARITWTALAPPALTRPFTTDAFLRLQPPTDAELVAATGRSTATAASYPDVVGLSGIVTRGAGLGADVEGLVVHQPTGENRAPIAGASTVVGGTLQPTLPSAAAVTNCQAGTSSLTGLLLGTDGASLGSLIDPALADIDSSLRISFPT